MQICLEEARVKAVEIQKTYTKEDQSLMERLQKCLGRFDQQSATRTVVPPSCDESAETVSSLSKSLRHRNRTDMQVTTPMLDKMDDYE